MPKHLGKYPRGGVGQGEDEEDKEEHCVRKNVCLPVDILSLSWADETNNCASEL